MVSLSPFWTLAQKYHRRPHREGCGDEYFLALARGGTH